MPIRPLSTLLAVTLAALAAGGGSAAAATPSLADESLSFLSSQVATYAGAQGPFAGGIWQSQNTICWACNNGGPAAAAATAYALSGGARGDLLAMARQTIDTAIATRQGPDGSFSPPPGTGDGQSPETATMFFGVEMGTAYLQLAGALDQATRARWQASLAAAADFLIRNGNVTWYTNGNINLGNIELLYLVWQATGDARYQTAYDNAWTFALSPPQDRFPGMGLRIVNAPTRADGSDGRGYLSETGAGGTGFDAEYSSLQLDIVSRLYLLSGDQRALRTANLLVNMLLPRVDSSWMLDTSGGTRHTEPSRKVDLLTSALAVLSLRGGRSDLAPMAMPQLTAAEGFFAQYWQFYNPVFRRALGNDVAVIALAAGTAGIGYQSGVHLPIPSGAPTSPSILIHTRPAVSPTRSGGRCRTRPQVSSGRRHHRRTHRARAVGRSHGRRAAARHSHRTAPSAVHRVAAPRCRTPVRTHSG